MKKPFTDKELNEALEAMVEGDNTKYNELIRRVKTAVNRKKAEESRKEQAARTHRLCNEAGLLEKISGRQWDLDNSAEDLADLTARLKQIDWTSTINNNTADEIVQPADEPAEPEQQSWDDEFNNMPF